MFKKIFYTIITLFILVVLVFGIYLYLQKPDYKGEITSAKVEKPVAVYYDDYGIPHIFAENSIDAMYSLGYVHAKDRLFQMELISRIAPGRLSEIFGEKLISVDKFFLGLGIDKDSEKQVAALDTTSVSYLEAMAYLEGVNSFVKEGKMPLEFQILGLEKRTFTLQDVFNVYGYMAFGFAMADKTDPLVSAIQEKLGDAYVQSLGMEINPQNTLIHTTEEDAVLFSKTVSALQDLNPIPGFIGSNSWVLSPEKTAKGSVIFENDPHIAFSQPATWFQAHIKTPEFESYGFYLALNPYPLLAHNRELAYGLTMFENDDIDLYTEKINPANENEYLVDEQAYPFIKNSYNIKVKGGPDVPFTVRETHRGMVVNEVVPQIHTESPISMYWVYMHRPNKLLEVCYKMSRAQDFEAFSSAPPLLHAPGLNIMYGDASGNIAWWASGHLYKRTGNPNTKMLLDGSNSTNDSIDYRPFEENPQAVNPTWNYVYSCNNQPDSIRSKRYIPGYYLPQDRAKRVVSLLDAKNDWTQAEIEQMTLDNTSAILSDLRNLLVQNISEKELSPQEHLSLDELKNWDGKATINSLGMTIFNQYIYEYYKQLMVDELGEEMFHQLVNTHLAKRLLEPFMNGKYDIWVDDIQTKEMKENNTDIQLRAYQNAIAKLQKQLGNDVQKWTWGKVHQVEHKHAFGENKLMRPFFNIGPFASAGTNEVLNNQLFDLTESINMVVKGGPSTRRVIDFSNVEGARAIIPTGNSGNVLSPHYKDQAKKYLDGDFIPMLLNEEKIKKSKNVLLFNP